MSEVPLIERLGLTIHWAKQPVFHKDYITTEMVGNSYVRADDLEALLQSAPVVYGSHSWTMNVGGPNEERSKNLVWDEHEGNRPVKTALLVGIQPIVKDSVESLLREFVASLDSIQERNDLRDIVERAKRLIGDK